MAAKIVFEPSIEFQLSARLSKGWPIIETYCRDIRSARAHFRNFVKNLPESAQSAALRMNVREASGQGAYEGVVTQSLLVERWERGPDGTLRPTFRREWDFAGGNLRRRL